MDINLFELVMVVFGIFIVSFVLKLLRQTNVISYILGGVLLGPYGLKWVSEPNLLNNLGELGIILLLFFVGMEVCIPCIISNFRITVLVPILQIVFSVMFAWLASWFFKWNFGTIILLGFVISLSSTAVVIKILQNREELNSRLGQYVVGILIVQDILVVPMILILNLLERKSLDTTSILLNITGAIILVSFVVYIIKKKEFRLPLHSIMREDHDLQVFAAFLICFGMAAISEFFGLSAALGAFVAGIAVASSQDTTWVSRSMHSFYIVLIALFFLYIGMFIDLSLLFNRTSTVLFLVGAVFVINTVINLVTFRVLGQDLRESLYAGALLSQIGEFSFILGARALDNKILSESEYNLIILIISLTMLLSPFWIGIIRKLTGVKCTGNVCT